MFIEHSLCARYCSHARFLITQCAAPQNEKVGLAEFLMKRCLNLTSTASNSIRSKQEFIRAVTLSLHILRSLGQMNSFLLKKKKKSPKPKPFLCSFVHPHTTYLLRGCNTHTLPACVSVRAGEFCSNNGLSCCRSTHEERVANNYCTCCKIGSALMLRVLPRPR